MKGELEEVSYVFPEEKFETEEISRNNGLVVITEDGKEELESYFEGDIIIDSDVSTRKYYLGIHLVILIVKDVKYGTLDA